MWKMSFCDSDQKSMPIVGFLTCNGSGIFCGPKLVPIGGLDTELISRLHRRVSHDRRLKPNEPICPEALSQSATRTSQTSSQKRPSPTSPLAKHGTMP